MHCWPQTLLRLLVSVLLLYCRHRRGIFHAGGIWHQTTISFPLDVRETRWSFFLRTYFCQIRWKVEFTMNCCGSLWNKTEKTEDQYSKYEISGPTLTTSKSLSLPCYSLEGEKYALVFNMKEFHPRTSLPRRDGTIHDVKAIERTFKTLPWLESWN